MIPLDIDLWLETDASDEYICSACGRRMEYDIDDGEATVWFSCPDYLSGDRMQHDSYGKTYTEIASHHNLE